LAEKIVPIVTINDIKYYNTRLFQGLRVAEILADDDIDEIYLEEAYINRHIDKLNDLRLFYTSPKILELQLEISRLEKEKWAPVKPKTEASILAEIAAKTQLIVDLRNKMEAEKNQFLIDALHKRGGGKQVGGLGFSLDDFNDDEDIDYEPESNKDEFSTEFITSVESLKLKKLHSENINIVFSKKIKLTNKSDSVEQHLYFNPPKYLNLIKTEVLPKWAKNKTTPTGFGLNEALAENDNTFNNKLESLGKASLLYEFKVLQTSPITLKKEDSVSFGLMSILNVLFMYDLTQEQQAEFRKVEERLNLMAANKLTPGENLAVKAVLEGLINSFYNGDICIAKFETDFEQDKVFFIKSTININDVGYSAFERTHILYLGDIYGTLKVGAKNSARFLSKHPRIATISGGAALGAAIGSVVGPLGSLGGAGLGAGLAGLIAVVQTVSVKGPATKEELAAEEALRAVENKLQEYLAVQSISAMHYLISRMDYICAVDISEMKDKPLKINMTTCELSTRAYQLQAFNIVYSGFSDALNYTVGQICMIPHGVYDFFYADEKWKRLPVHAALTAIFKNKTLSLSYLKKSTQTKDMLNDLVCFAKENMQYMDGYTKIDNMYFADTKAASNVDISPYKNADEVERENLINFNINPNLIIPSMKDFPSTYNAPLGKLLIEYETDRENFLESRKWKDAALTAPKKKSWFR
jgi:hypothetical protein